MRSFAEFEDHFYTARSNRASNLTGDGDTNTNDAVGASDIALRIDAGTEGRPINLEIELEMKAIRRICNVN